MRKLALSLAVLGATLLALLFAAPANAQATRTWVSGVGDDANPCSRTAPCKTFAGAISKTIAGGEISTLDPGGFGGVTITKSISLTNDGAGEAGILVNGTNAITVAAGANDIINIRGLVLDGGAPASSGLNGIKFNTGGTLNIQNCVIKNFTQSSSAGIQFAPSGSARMMIRDTVISNTGSGTTGGAIVIAPTGSAFASVTLTRVTMDSNGNGLLANAASTTGDVLVTVLDSSASANNGTGFGLTSGSGTNSVLALNRVGSVNNTTGISSTGANATVLLSNSVVTTNNVGITSTSGGKIISYLNNVLLNNFGSASPTSTQAGQ